MEEKQAKFKWSRGRTLGKGSYGFVSLASTDTPSPMIPSLIAVKSSGNVADRIDERGLPEFQVQKYTKNVVLGLSLIHKKGIIHCDIKPQNILLMAEVAKIADFGLSITLEQNWKENMGHRGTKRYMAPEALIKEEYYPGVDIWSLGCTVYEMIAGNHPIQIMICCTELNVLLNHSFLKSADDVQPPDTKKRQCDGMSLLRKKRTKTAFRTQPHIRDLVIQLDSDSKDGNSCPN
ncbi:hypothetical protein H5410_006573 [Solanum commersonii]|uniref:Protein kinase domain-containing protein n=1 Tax=Solanum commersonii TaxID=4109 RepID=A0A9J6AAN7_SOLCO|nr:hypothetical protein H5410_006573 [Solanum commersonii]